jgi:glycosyltransferase involved in cell wall biosynthesis
VIIFANRAHYSAIGGVENSIRSLTKETSKRKIPAMVLCREALGNESLDVDAVRLPLGTELLTYKDEFDSYPLLRLMYLRHGGYTLKKVYRNLYYKYPSASIVARHHAHVLAAHSAGFKKICYLVPSLSATQLQHELTGANLFVQLRLRLHILIDGAVQKRSLKYSKLFVFSQPMKDAVIAQLPKSLGAQNVSLVRPGIDRTRFVPPTTSEKVKLRMRLGLPIDRPLFLFVGRFVQAKGLGFILEALPRLAADCGAILVGDGERKAAVKTQITTLGLDRRVRVDDATSRVEDYYRACDVFVMSSTYEPFGQTILEAVACGLRVVAFHRSTGVKTATHELGLDAAIDYAHQLDADGLAQAMKRALEKLSIGCDAPEVLAQMGGHDRVINAYSWSALLDQLLE